MQFELYRRFHLAATAEAFKQDMFQELGVVESPMAEEMYGIAWRLGHMGGPEEVYWMFFDLLESIRS